MADRDTLATLAEELTIAFMPLTAAFRTPATYRDFLEELGWKFTAVPGPLDALERPVGDAVAFISEGQVEPPQIPQLLKLVRDAYKAIADLSLSTDLPAGFKDEFPRQLVDYLIVDYLLTQQPRWGFLFIALGLVKLQDEPAHDGRLAFTRRVVEFDKLGDLFSDPLGFLKNSYRWGESDFANQRMAQSLVGLLRAWGFEVREQRLDLQTLARLKAGALSPANTFDSTPELVFVEHSLDPEIFSTRVALFFLPATAADKPGFALLPFATAEFVEEIDITDNLTLAFSGELDLSGSVGIFVRPNKDIEFLSGLGSGTPVPITGNLGLALRLGQPGEPIMIVGKPDASRLEFGGISTAAGTRFFSGNKFEVFTEFALQAGKIIIKPPADDGDSFVGKLLSSDGVEIGFDLVVGFSTTRGLYFRGSGGFEIAVPANVQIGSVEILSALLAVRFRDGGLPVDVAATIRSDLSVLKASVENVGLTASFTFPVDRKGNLGPVDLQLKFKPPTGVGIAINAGPITGGGFIGFKDGRYGGALVLKVYSVTVKAFGLIETKLPDGAKGFSFVIIISAEFTPIQLGLGFTLNGVGGIIGINRRIDEEGLRRAVRDGSLEHLLFPHDVEHNAPQIIHDLTAILPATEGRHVFGPMAKIGWGTPTIIEAEIGIILELPGPRLALLGEIHALLPTKDKGLVTLNLSVAGLLDFPKKFFAIDASLHDSKVGSYPITGDMAMRLLWGDNPSFALAVGGFNPAFQPPPSFPVLRRVAVDLGVSGNPSLTLQGYFAITSNTAQVGALAELRARGSGITLYGRVQFDAIFVFSPFSFEAAISAQVRITFHGRGIGVHLRGTLSGPSPWRVRGEVCVSILWWDACLGFDKSFGSAQRVELPAINPWTGTLEPAPPKEVSGLKDALEDVRNWTPELPLGAVSVVSLAEASSDSRPVDPLGVAVVRQRVCPLNLQLQRFGSAKADGPAKFVLDSVTVNGTTVKRETITFLKEPFAKAQFLQMSDAAKLSAPSFEPLDGAIRVPSNDNAIAAGSVEEPKEIKYKTKVLGAPTFDEDPLPEEHLAGMKRRSATGLFGLRRVAAEAYIDPTAPPRFIFGSELFVIGSRKTFKTRGGILGGAVRKIEAALALAEHLVNNPEEQDDLQVFPKFEMGGR